MNPHPMRALSRETGEDTDRLPLEHEQEMVKVREEIAESWGLHHPSDDGPGWARLAREA